MADGQGSGGAMIALGVVCAVLGAVAAAFGAWLQHRGVTAVGRTHPAALLRNPAWRLGVLVLTACTVLQALALALAPVTVVTPIVVLALPILTVLNGPRDPLTRVAVAAVTLAVAVFVTLTARDAKPATIPPDTVLDAGQLVGIIVVSLVAVAAFAQGIARSAALAVAAGVGYGLVAVLIKDVLHADGLPWLSVLATVLAFATAAWLVQHAYASGPPDVVVGCQTAANPVVATGLGMTVLGEAPALDLPTLAACGATAIAGIAVLAVRRDSLTGARATPSSNSPGRPAAWSGTAATGPGPRRASTPRPTRPS
ncbi:hypothetical protein GCM10017786_66980 [Amycolatopsis deserti]|uniref:Integral membrane protein n=1 Tax=Amycolatopsis deserti TaxID=185696 RepID=A0ABQ3JEV4_9PSEU|nr:hypothetical protein [Amycolatopsis deserti]GHF23398.1 hypothetical protein GCM10017786_66980 [Amycolatopsis deserti]